ncbi:NAD(P)-dependent oxidoreductase [Roseiarcaceae bacterium H3SJ34-1]|uniref:NAD(P)-dependent oxidoreductase n=1 Tax=Terripilifer ovatus TaxID=3032367 RepID=UPI003AB98F33|nr:NAD(P)-dependent oxidoreductase [Roseiarcaceae bacterium H3SJ34-1]
MDPIRSVGIVGLGKMGAPIARHLAAAGFETHGLDVNQAAMAAAQKNGIKIAANAAELARRSDLVIVLTAFEEQVEEVIFGAEGVAAGARPGTVVAVAATINPDSMRDMAERLSARGLVALDIPICRGEGPAEAGELLITGGGEAEAFEACRPAFASFANSIHLLGGPGAGQAGKMINNLILWACISANTEGFKLGNKYGITKEAMRNMLLESSAQNWAMSTDVDPSYMPWAEKDMMIVLSEADRVRLSMPMAGVVKEVIKGIKIEHGH